MRMAKFGDGLTGGRAGEVTRRPCLSMLPSLVEQKQFLLLYDVKKGKQKR